MTDEKSYRSIVSYCESFLDRYGDCHLGVGWTKTPETADRRHQVMLDVVRGPSQGRTLLDLGCGASHLLEYMLRTDSRGLHYSGLDLSPRFLELSRRKFPQVTYYQADLLTEPGAVPEFDYVVLSGLFTSKCEFSFAGMSDYFQRMIVAAFAKARVGVAFNVMTKLVEWERDDLFHLPFDELGHFLARRVSRDFVIRHDYGLYDYTAYVYR